MDKSTPLFLAGLTLITGGVAVASPIDELAVTAATGGAGAIVAPIQGAVGVAGGIAAVATGFALIGLSAYLDK